MDKETLSNYGWITICVLVIAVMVALATPFGSFIKTAVENTTQGLYDTSAGAINSTELMSIAGQSFANNSDAATSNSTIPAGCTYYANPGVEEWCSGCGDRINLECPSGICDKCDTAFEHPIIILSAGDAFPNTVSNGDKFETSDYTYTYSAANNGWAVVVRDTSKTAYDEILETINDVAVTNMEEGFHNCYSLVETPTIPIGITNAGYIVRNCENLTAINYAGTIAQWNAIQKYGEWDDQTWVLTVIHCSDGDIPHSFH